MKKDFQRVLADDSGDAAFFCAQNHREECCNNFQKLICNQHAEFKDAIAYQHVTIVEAHAGWCGPTDCVKLSLWQMGMQNDTLKFATASTDKIQLLKEYQGRVKPMFLVYKDSKRLAEIEGAACAACCKCAL